MLKIEFLSVILLDSLDAGHNLYLLLLLPKILLLNVHLLDVQCNIHNLLPGTRFFLSVLDSVKLFDCLIQCKLGFVVSHDFLDALEAKDKLCHKRKPVGVEATLEDVNVAGVRLPLRSS